jgi:hypothetical protein
MFPMTVTVTTPAQLSAVMMALGVPGLDNVPEKAKAEPAKKPTPAAAPTVEAAAAASTAPAEAVAAPEPKAENSAPQQAYTYDDAAKAVQNLAKAKGRDAAVAVLAKFGVAKLPELTDTSKFADVIAACTEAAKG